MKICRWVGEDYQHVSFKTMCSKCKRPTGGDCPIWNLIYETNAINELRRKG